MARTPTDGAPDGTRNSGDGTRARAARAAAGTVAALLLLGAAGCSSDGPADGPAARQAAPGSAAAPAPDAALAPGTGGEVSDTDPATFEAAVAGCETGAATVAPPSPSTEHGMILDAAVGYTSLEQLDTDADVVLLGRAGNAVVGTEHGVPTTVTELTALHVLRGDAAAMLLVQQTGAADISGISLLSPGSCYVLFLDRFIRPDNQLTGEYVIVGVDQGMWEVEGTTLRRAGEPFGELPLTVAAAEMDDAVRG